MLLVWSIIEPMKQSGPAMMKRKHRYQQAIVKFPERKAFYESQIALLEAELLKIKACLRCGRPLRGEESQNRGYGPECARKSEVRELLEEEHDAT
jgi:hypothetical protein